MIHTGYDLPRSLEVCDQLAGSWDQTACTGGVFMENISSSYGIKSKWLRDDDLLYPCKTVAERHKLYCYLMVTSRILPAVGYDFGKAATFAGRASRAWIATCFQSLGRDASGTSRQKPAKILEYCRTAGDMIGDCVYGAAQRHELELRRRQGSLRALRAGARRDPRPVLRGDRHDPGRPACRARAAPAQRARRSRAATSPTVVRGI